MLVGQFLCTVYLYPMQCSHGTFCGVGWTIRTGNWPVVVTPFPLSLPSSPPFPHCCLSSPGQTLLQQKGSERVLEYSHMSGFRWSLEYHTIYQSFTVVEKRYVMVLKRIISDNQNRIAKHYFHLAKFITVFQWPWIISSDIHVCLFLLLLTFVCQWVSSTVFVFLMGTRAYYILFLEGQWSISHWFYWLIWHLNRGRGYWSCAVWRTIGQILAMPIFD